MDLARIETGFIAVWAVVPCRDINRWRRNLQKSQHCSGKMASSDQTRRRGHREGRKLPWTKTCLLIQCPARTCRKTGSSIEYLRCRCASAHQLLNRNSLLLPWSAYWCRWQYWILVHHAWSRNTMEMDEHGPYQRPGVWLWIPKPLLRKKTWWCNQTHRVSCAKAIDMNFSAKIANLTDKEITGQVQLQLIDATTNQSVDGWFKNVMPNQYFTVPAKQSVPVTFSIEIPLSI